MNATVIKVAKKIGTLVVTVGLPMACDYMTNKKLETRMRQIAEEVLNSGKKID